MEAPPPASAPLPTQGLAYSQPHPLRNRYPHSHLHSHSLADGREEGGQTDRDKASVVIMHTRLTQKNTASSKTAMKTKGKNNKGPASVLLVAVRTPADVLSVRNELARVERRDAAEAATATAAATSTPLADAAAFFGGIAASLLPPLDFHARAASATAKRARDTELLVYANLSYACVRGHPLLIVTSPVRFFIHFAQVAYIIDEQHLCAACQFALVLNTRQELRFLCNSSAEYLQWIDCLYKAYTACYSSPINQIPRDLDYDDRKSIHSQFGGGGRRRPVSGSFFQQIPQHSMSRSGSHNPGYTYSPQPIPNFLPESTRMMINSGPGMIRQTSNKRQLQNQSWHFPAKVHGSPQISRYQQSQQQSSDQYYNQNTENSGHLDSHVKLMSSRVGTSVLKRSSISGDRVKRSTRPTKMQDDYDNIGNDNDEIDFESGSDSADFINQKRMQRSVSTPPRSFYTKTTATVGTVAAALRNQAGSKDRKHRSRTADEVYEMTVNAYQADLAEEIGEERRRNASTSRNNSDNNNQNVNYGNTSARNRAVIPEPRLSSSSMSLARSGFQTRVGSLVRFSGEDEIAYEIMHTQSDASSGGTGSRGNSLQRQNNKYDKDENVIEEEDENLTILEPVKDQESPPAEVPTFALQNFESRSKSVDTRVRSAAVTQHDILKARRKEIEKELAIPPLILAARSVSVDTRTTSAAARLLQSPLSSPVVQKKKFKNESLYSIPSFNSAVHKKDASVQGKKAKKPALNSNSLNSDSKAYLLPTLFGSKNLPTVREANNSEENDSNSSDQSHQAVVTSPAIRNTTIVGAVLVSSPPPAAVPNQEYHQFLRKVSQYLPHSPQPPQPPPSSLSSPLQARYDDIKPQYSVDETIVDTSWLEYAANLSVSEHVECLSTDTLALLQEMRSAKNEAAAELVGATAFGLGYYDDFGRPTKQGTADVMTAFLGKSSAVSVVEQQFKGDDGLVQKKNEETTLVSDDDGNGDEMDDSDLSASVARLKKSRLHQISAAIGTEKSPTNSNSTSSPSSNPALKKVFNNMMAPAAKPSLSSSALPFLVSPVVSVTIDGGGGESPISPSFSSFAFPPPRSMSRTYSKQPARDVNSNNNSIQLLQSRSNDVGNSDYFPAMAVSPSLKNTSTRMCLTMASLRESLIESLQSSPGYVNATIANEQQQQKVDSEKVQNTKMEIVETLQKVNPVVKGTVVMSTIDVIAPVADEGGDGGFGRAVTEFESFQQRSGEKV